MKSNVPTNSARAWLLASRPKTLTAALIPVIVATALAYNEGAFRLIPAFVCMVFASLMQIAANFVNDYFDFRKGTDREDRLGPERACALGWITPSAMRIGIAVVLVAACMVGLTLLCYGGLELVAVGVACVVFCFLYTTLLSYCGLGDVLVLLFFGFVPVLGCYYVQASELSSSAWWCALACGLAIDDLLVVNNYRDRDTDRLSGKRTLIVILGERFGRYFYECLGLAACASLIPFALDGRWPAFVLPLLYLIPHTSTWRRMVRIHEGRVLNSVLGLTSRNMLLFALLLAAGLLLSGRV